MQEIEIQQIIIPKEGIKLVFLDEKGRRKEGIYLTQENIFRIVRRDFFEVSTVKNDR